MRKHLHIEGKRDTTVTISFVVPVFDAEKYIGKALESLCRQTEPSIEVVMVNDGSPDNSGEICRRFAESDARFVYHEQENAGLSGARNAGIARAGGRYIAFLDADDYFDPDFAARICSDKDFGTADIFMFGNKTRYPDGRVTTAFPTEEKRLTLSSDESLLRHFCLDWILPQRNSYCWNKCYRRETVQAHGAQFPPGIRFSEDRYFNYLLLPHVRSVACLHFAPYNYRIHEESACHTVAQRNNLIKQYIWTYRRVTEKWAEQGVRAFDIVKPLVLLRALQASFMNTMQAVRDLSILAQHAEEAFADIDLEEELRLDTLQLAIDRYAEICGLSWAEKSKWWLFALSLLDGGQGIAAWQRLYPGYCALCKESGNGA